MHCPNCNHANLPGSEACGNCQQSLTGFDGPAPQDRVERGLMADPVSVLEPRAPVSVPLDADLGAAMRAMTDRGVGAVLVLDAHGTLVGILTERDFLTKVAGQPGATGLPVRDFMTANPETVSSADTVGFALGKMDLGGYRHLPVANGGKPVGVISVRDILRYVTGLCRDG